MENLTKRDKAVKNALAKHDRHVLKTSVLKTCLSRKSVINRRRTVRFNYVLDTFRIMNEHLACTSCHDVLTLRRRFDNAAFRAYTNVTVTSQNNACYSARFM